MAENPAPPAPAQGAVLHTARVWRGAAEQVRGRRGRFTVDRLHRPGVDPVRVLLLTDHDLAGVRDGGRSVPHELASRLGVRSSRAVDLDVLTDLTPALKAMGSAFRAWRAWRYDAVVVLLDARDDRAVLRRRIPRLLDDLGGAAVLPTPIVVAGVVDGRAVGQARHRTRTALLPAAAARQLATGSAVLELAADGAERAWAEVLADALAEVPRLHARIELPQDEDARQRALDATGAVRRTADPALERIVELTRQAFDAESAEVNVLDHDLQRRVAVVGAGAAPTPRSESICDITIRRAAPNVIMDTRVDARTAENPVVVSGRIGFYAAYPIESLEGYRIGALCVYDSRPRNTDVDLSLLRDFALLAEAELIDEVRHRPD